MAVVGLSETPGPSTGGDGEQCGEGYLPRVPDLAVDQRCDGREQHGDADRSNDRADNPEKTTDRHQPESSPTSWMAPGVAMTMSRSPSSVLV